MRTLPNKKTVHWVKEDLSDSLEQNALCMKVELGYATQRAIVDNLESLDETGPRKSLFERIKGGNKQ
jgi:hypothetical protein